MAADKMNNWRSRRTNLAALSISCFVVLLLIYYWTLSGPPALDSDDVANIPVYVLDISAVSFKPPRPTVAPTSRPAAPAKVEIPASDLHYPVSNTHVKVSNPSFGVEGNRFVRDGRPFAFRAGTAHYWRRPAEFWEDTMLKIKALGLNAVQTYISWNLHEPEPEQYDFKGALDVRCYFELANKHGLLVILRPGPFINAEMDLGGLPYWLLRLDPKMAVRTGDKSYFRYVERWYRKLLPMLKDMMYAQGGPIVMVQVENEYGSYNACDVKYLSDLRDLTRELIGPETLLYTTDGSGTRRSYMECGRIKDVVTTVDFGAGADTQRALSIFREWVPVGPFMNSEFYPGWINHWSRPWKLVPFEKVVKSTEELLDMGASFTFYPIVGGTNFGFTIGANLFEDGFSPGTTSYDFDAPVSEGGELTEKYMKLLELFKKRNLAPNMQLPVVQEKFAYGHVQMAFCGSLFDNLAKLSPDGSKHSEAPLTFEELEHPYGFVLYRTTVSEKCRDPSRLAITGLHDRAVVMINKKRQGMLSRTSDLTEVNIFVQQGDVLDILVQNEGRATAGDHMNDFKGIVGDVLLQNESLSSWEHYPIQLPGFPVHSPVPLPLVTSRSAGDVDDLGVPSFYSGMFNVTSSRDTFLKLHGWRQGYAFVNGFNIGRYWPVVGPQLTLFVPAVFLKENSQNVLQLFEVDGSPCSAREKCFVEFVALPEVGETTERIHRIH